MLATEAAARDRVVWTVSEGLTPYAKAETWMRERAAAIRTGTADETVWLLEHPPLFTAGTSAREADCANPLGLPVFRPGRGGQWTYHGPGQRIAYVLLDLARPHGSVPARDVHAYVEGLERWAIAALARLGIAACRRPGRVGAWVIGPDGREEKIAAVGVRVTRWVSFHGLAINRDPDLAHFAGIVPCGIREHGVTSIAAQGKDARAAVLDRALFDTFPAIFGPVQAVG